MNLRLSIVILAAGLFMAIWNADQRAIQKQAVAARARYGTPAIAAGKPGTNSSILTPALLPGTSATSAATTVVASATEGTPLPPVETVIPLPTNLAAGTWTAVSEDGNRTVITVHQTPAAANTEHHFCIVTSDHGRRWCFVRTPADRVAEASNTQQ
jgi:hypothetical protein